MGLRAAFRIERAVIFVLAPVRWLVALVVLVLAWFAWRAGLPSFDLAELLRPFGAAPSSVPKDAPVVKGITLGLTALVAASIAVLGLSRWRRRSTIPPARPESFVLRGDSLLDMVIEGNRRLVSWTLDHRLLASTLGLLAFLTIGVPMGAVPKTVFGQEDSADSLNFRVSFDADFTLSEAEQQVAIYERFLEERQEEWGFEHWSNRFSDRWASLSMYWDLPISKKRTDELRLELKESLPRIPGHRLRFYDEERTTERSRTVARFRLTGPDSTVLERLGAEAKRILEGVPGLKGVSTPRDDGPDQVSVSVDRELALGFGLDSDTVQQNIAYVLHGFQLPRYQEEGRDVPFIIEYDEEKVSGLSALRDLGIWSGTGSVPLSSFADLSFEKGPRRIHRRNGRTGFTLTAEVEDPLRVLEITEAGHRALGALDLPRGYEVDRTDSALERQEAEFGELLRAFALSVVLVFLVMGILFESVLLPFSVLLTIPFAVLGAFWTLFLTGTALDFVGLIGLIILAGVVVNNGIVLIDRIHRLVGEGMDRSTAVVVGCGNRVRPILMTALTTVTGLIPMIVAEPATDSIDYRSLATLVAGGLACSTFFTLWVVPLAYTVFDDLSHVLRARARWWFRRPGEAAPAGTAGLAGGGLRDRV